MSGGPSRIPRLQTSQSSALWPLGLAARPWLLQRPRKTRLPDSGMLWPRGHPRLKFSFMTPEQAVLASANTGALSPGRAPGRGPVGGKFPKGGLQPQPPASRRSAQESGPEKRRRGRVGPATLECAPPSGTVGLAARGPFVMHMRVPRLSKGPHQHGVTDEEHFVSQSAGLAHACCFPVASHSKGPVRHSLSP